MAETATIKTIYYSVGLFYEPNTTQTITFIPGGETVTILERYSMQYWYVSYTDDAGVTWTGYVYRNHLEGHEYYQIYWDPQLRINGKISSEAAEFD